MRMHRKQHPCSHTIKTGEPCHIWIERLPRARHVTTCNAFNFTNDDDNFFVNSTFNQQLIHDANITYSQVVDRCFMTPPFLNSCIKGTNDRANRYNDNKYTITPTLSQGRLDFKLYWAVELSLQLWNRTVDELFEDDALIGIPQLSRLLPKPRFESIRRNFCMNPNANFTRDKTNPDYNRYCDWEEGIEILFNNSRRAIDMDVHLKVIDEARMLDTSPSNVNSTMSSMKPDRKAVDVSTVCVQLENFKGYTIGAKVYNKGKMVDQSIKIDEREGDTDNLVNQLVTQTQADGSVYVQDKKYNSMFVHEVLAPAKSSEFIGMIRPDAQHLPTSSKKQRDGTTKYGYFMSPQWKRRAKAMEPGDFVQFYCGKINLTAIQLKKKGKDPVLVIDTCVNWRKYVEIEVRGKTCVVPAVVLYYRQWKGFCDTANQRRAAFGIERRSKRKYRNTFMGLAELLLFVNSSMVFADIYNLKKFDAKRLRTDWVLNTIRLAQAARPSARRLKPRRKTVRAIRNELLCRSGEHKLVKYDKEFPKKQIECFYCRRWLRERKLTTYRCSLCSVYGNPVGFCKKRGRNADHPRRNCFELFVLH